MCGVCGVPPGRGVYISSLPIVIIQLGVKAVLKIETNRVGACSIFPPVVICPIMTKRKERAVN